MEPSHVVPISDAQLAFSALLVVISAGVSAVFRLGLLTSLLWGTVRCFVQLSVVGFLLTWIFGTQSPWVVMIVVALMCGIASRTATRRTPNVTDFPAFLAFVSLASSTYLVLVIVSAVIIRADPWYTPRIAIPIAGMILGNAANGIALSIDRLYAEVRSRRDEVEAFLTLGATRWEAVRGCVREALRAGMTPAINSLMLVGVVSIPGMMTGQILAGANPAEAARYQIVVMLMVSASVAFGSMMLVGISYIRLFTRDDALRPELSTSKH